jgi:hypothetical protein
MLDGHTIPSKETYIQGMAVLAGITDCNTHDECLRKVDGKMSG